MPVKKTEAVRESIKQPEVVQKDSNILAAIGYLFGIVALIIYFVKKEDKFVAFHALQSVAYWITVLVIAIGFSIISIPLAFVGAGFVGLCILPIWGVAILYAIYLAYLSFQGQKYKIPVIGDFVEKYV